MYGLVAEFYNDMNASSSDWMRCKNENENEIDDDSQQCSMVQAEKPAELVGAPSSAYRLGHPFGQLFADPTKLIFTLGVFPRSLFPCDESQILHSSIQLYIVDVLVSFWWDEHKAFVMRTFDVHKNRLCLLALHDLTT
jgi:hypothetical protein